MLILKKVLQEEGEWAIGVIAANIFRNKQNASGRTIQSLREESSDTELGIFAQKSITTLQTGVFPGTYVPTSVINTWGQTKGYWQEKNYRANTISRRIFNYGSLVFRNGGRTDVYTDVVPQLVERIKQRVGEVVINTKIIQ